MANTLLDEKGKVWELIESKLGPMRKGGRSSDWRISSDGTTSIFVTSSKIHANNMAWFDIKLPKLINWLEYRRSFVVFVVEHHLLSFVLPASVLKDEIDKSRRKLTGEDNFVIHIVRGDSYTVLEFVKFDLMNYQSAFEQIGRPRSSKESNASIAVAVSAIDSQDAEEAISGQKYAEGAVTTILVNVYERNAVARSKCLEFYGLNCSICGFDFRMAYGELGGGYIQVHHIVPLSEVGDNYRLNPIEDLRPVCPNCHAMLHRRRPPYSIDDIKRALSS